MSSMCRRNMRQLLCFMALAMTILMLCSSFVSPIHGSNSSSYAASDSAGSYADAHNSLQRTEKQFFFTALFAQLALQEMPVRKIVRQTRNWQSFLQIVHGVLILWMSMLLFIHNSVNLAGKKKKHISVIAFSIGGHAPPSAQAL